MTVEDVLHDLIEVSSMDQEGLKEMAVEFPEVADKIAQMIDYRKQVGERFQKIVAAKRAGTRASILADQKCHRFCH